MEKVFGYPLVQHYCSNEAKDTVQDTVLSDLYWWSEFFHSLLIFVKSRHGYCWGDYHMSGICLHLGKIKSQFQKINILSSISYPYFKQWVVQSPSPLTIALLPIFKWEEYSDFRKSQCRLKNLTLKVYLATKYIPLNITFSTIQLFKNTVFTVIYVCDNLNQSDVVHNWLSGFSGILSS